MLLYKNIITYFKSGNAHANMTNVIPMEPANAKLINLRRNINVN